MRARTGRGDQRDSEARMPLFGGIEAGGTKFVCAVGAGPHDLHSRVEFPTSAPGETLGRVLEFFAAQVQREPITAIGIASFGPIDVNRLSPHYGQITSTPKAGWQNVDLVGPVRQAFNLPV